MLKNLYGIIGHPLGHSLSPMLHSAAFQMLGIPAALVAWPVAPYDLSRFMDAFRLLNIQGSCVTIPHKEAIIPLLDCVSERARAVGAVNLIYRKNGQICGDNTDVVGFMAPLRGMLKPGEKKRALVLGAGGAGRSVVAGLAELGFRDITVAYNSKPYPTDFAERFALKQAPWENRLGIPADLIINVTPLGMKGARVDETPYPAEAFARQGGIAYDIVYTPAQTRFLREAAQAGWRCIGGLPMFLGQAEAQFFTWTGQALPLAAQDMVRAALTEG